MIRSLECNVHNIRILASHILMCKVIPVSRVHFRIILKAPSDVRLVLRGAFEIDGELTEIEGQIVHLEGGIADALVAPSFAGRYWAHVTIGGMQPLNQGMLDDVGARAYTQ